MPSQAADVPHFVHHRDVRDDRDVPYAPGTTGAGLPSAVDLRSLAGAVYDQSPYHSCSAHALSSVLTLLANKEGAPIAQPSRLFVYYNERLLGDERPISDSGSSLRNGIKAIVKNGTCPETTWAYTKPVNDPPPQDAYSSATMHALQYARIAQNLDDIKACLAEGYPLVLAMQVFKSMGTVRTDGMLPMPLEDETPIGQHAVMCAGYDNAKSSLLCLNSYGSNFGMQGWFYMPYPYTTNPTLAFDFWTIRKLN